MNKIYPLRDLLVTLSAECEASTNTNVITTSLPRGWGIVLWGNSSSASRYISLNSSWFALKSDVSILGSSGLNYNVIFGFFFKYYPDICSSCCSMCPWRGLAWNCDSRDNSNSMSTLPISVAHLSIPIISWYIFNSSGFNSSDVSNSGTNVLSIGVNAREGIFHIVSFTLSSTVYKATLI